ncbi:PD-(D/E)XK nuclease family protein [Patescibacteria group bacterium]|nr:PD-(D/E)XK nuclease family protein [Patescibacteria group bacterium]
MGFGYSVRKKEYCFDPVRHGKKSTSPYAISRSKIDLFVECPRCFYLDQRLGIKRPDSYPLTLNNAVDELMKREFDLVRVNKEPHPLMEEAGIDAVPYTHKDLELWRDAMKNGVKYLEPETNLIIRGGIDDVWENSQGELHVVDYKATSKKEQVTLDAEWQNAYKRQVEVYQWLFLKNGFKVSPIAYFVYANGNSDADTFDATLEFDMTIIPYTGSTDWIQGTVEKLYACLMEESTPKAGKDCSYCMYREVAGKTLYAEMVAQKKKQKE